MKRWTWYWCVCFRLGQVWNGNAMLLWPHMTPIEGNGVGRG